MFDRHKILQPEEIQQVLKGLRRRGHTKNGRLNLVIFRLSCCYGLRACEIIGLNISDLVVEGTCPTLTVRKAVTKGKASYGKKRVIRLDIDSGSLADIREWYEKRTAETVDPNAPFVCGQSSGPLQKTEGKRLTEDLIALRWRTAIKCLPAGRRKQVSIHGGRHSFVSHALAAGYHLVEVKELAGHANVATTDLYAHALDRTERPDVFAFAR